MISGKTIVFIATVAWSRNWQRQHEWATRLAQNNCVLYISPYGMTSMGPLTIVNKFKKENGFMFEHPLSNVTQKNLQHARLWFIPIRDIGWLNKLNSFLMRRQLKRLGVVDGPETIFWTCNPADTTSALLTRYPKSRVVFDIAMRFTLLPDAPEWICDSQAEVARRADTIIYDSPAELLDLPSDVLYKTNYIPQGFDEAVLEKNIKPAVDPRLEKIPHPRAVYIGISTVLDIQLVNELLLRIPDIHIVMIGDVQPHPLEHPRLHWLGPINVDKKDSYLRACDVGLIPYTISEYTAGTFPTKFFEYLANGLPVVSTNLPALAPYAEHLALTQTREEFCAAVKEALSAAQAIPRKFLQHHSWKQRFSQVEKIISNLA